MKRALKSIILVTVLLCAVMGYTYTAHAEEYYDMRVEVTTQWKTVAKNTQGINGNVKVCCNVIGVTRVDVRMLGKNNNVVWSESNSCPALSNRVYHCGADVYTVQVKVSTSSAYGTAFALKTSEPAD